MPDWMIQLGGTVAGVGVLYGAIRADLANAREAARRAHERIDEHLGDHLRGQLSRGLGG